MPFASPEQQLYLMINFPDIYKKWIKAYGPHPKFREYMRKQKRRKRRFNEPTKNKRRRHS